MTVDELGRRMDADELGYWVAKCALERDAGQLRDLGSTVERELIKARQE